MILSPEKVEGLLYLVTFCGGGWAVALQMQKNRLEEKIADVKRSTDAQWLKVDVISGAYMSKDGHRQICKDTTGAVERSIAHLEETMGRSIDRLSEKLDRLIENGGQHDRQD